MSSNAVDFRGIWVGEYGPHGKEIIRITEQADGKIRGTKITGDRNMPAETVSFEFLSNAAPHSGRGQVAEVGYHHPRWIDASVSVASPNLLKVDFFAIGSITLERLEDSAHCTSSYQFDLDCGAAASGDAAYENGA